jgi:hypothetical protein
MNRRPHLCLLLLTFLVPLSCFAAPGSLSLDEYRRQLEDFQQRIDSLRDRPEKAAGVEVSIPDSETVRTAQGEITVSHRDLKEGLVAFSRADSHRREALRAQIEAYVRGLQSEAEAYGQNTVDSRDARARLEAILARREFRRVENTPSLSEVLLAKIFGWIVRVLSKLPFGLGSRFDWFQLLVYGLLATALALVLIWTVRRLRRPREEPAAREIMPFAPSARSWRTWLAQAQDRARQQDWRGAIHLAYWAGISILEERGSWRPNRARTPREYLHLLTSGSAQYPILAALTRKFELVWYGHREAGEGDFKETLTQLEQLGCR